MFAGRPWVLVEHKKIRNIYISARGWRHGIITDRAIEMAQM